MLILILSIFAAGAAAAQGSKDRSLSLPELDRRVRADSNDPALQLQLGRKLQEAGRHDDAERRFRHVVAVAPGLAAGYLALGSVPKSRGESYWKKREKKEGLEPELAAWNEASKFVRLAFLLDPLVDPALIPRVQERVTLRIDGVNYRVWWMLPLGKAINAFRAGKYADAKRKLDNLLKDPSAGTDGSGLPGDVLWFRALASAHLNDYQTAATDFTVLMTHVMREAEQGMQGTPLLANDHRYMAAVMLYYSGQNDVARVLLQEALGADPSLYMAHSQLARIHEDAGRLDEAAAERQRAVDANPDNGSLLADLGLTLLRAGMNEEAFDAFVQAGTMNSRDSRAAYQAGVTALALGRREQARKWLQRFAAIAPARMGAQRADAQRHLESIK